MKSLKDFASNQLSKNQMNSLTGGECWDCTISDVHGILLSGPGCGNSRDAVMDQLMDMYDRDFYFIECN